MIATSQNTELLRTLIEHLEELMYGLNGDGVELGEFELSYNRQPDADNGFEESINTAAKLLSCDDLRLASLARDVWQLNRCPDDVEQQHTIAWRTVPRLWQLIGGEQPAPPPAASQATTDEAWVTLLDIAELVDSEDATATRDRWVSGSRNVMDSYSGDSKRLKTGRPGRPPTGYPVDQILDHLVGKGELFADEVPRYREKLRGVILAE